MGATLQLGRITPKIPNLKNLIVAACSGNLFLRDVAAQTVQMYIRGHVNVHLEGDARGMKLSHYMSDFDAVLGSAKGKKKPILFGYSHAGYFATSYALGNQEKIGGLILMEPALYTPKEELLNRANLASKGQGAQAIEAMIHFTDPKIGRNKLALAKTSEAIMKDMASNDLLAEEFRIRAEHPIVEEQLKGLNVPTFLIGGTASGAAYMVERAARVIPKASVLWIRGATHLDLIGGEFATQVGAAINACLNQLD